MNANRKHDFVETLSIDKRAAAEDVLNAVAPVEADVGVDVAEMSFASLNRAIERSADDIATLYTDIDGISLRMMIADVIYKYNKWCRKNGIPASGLITQCQWVAAAKASSWMIASPRHLAQILNDTLDPESEQTADLCIRGVVWLTYAGLTRDEILNLSTSAFRASSMSVTVQRDGVDVKVKIPREGVPSLRMLVTLDSFVSYHPSSEEGIVILPRYNSDRLVRGAARVRKSSLNPMPTNSVVFINNAFSRWRGADNIDLSYEKVYRCGFYHRAYSIETAGAPITERNQVFGRNVRITKEFMNEELERLVDIRLGESGEGGNKSAARRQHWRKKVYNEYLLWKVVTGK